MSELFTFVPCVPCVAVVVHSTGVCVSVLESALLVRLVICLPISYSLILSFSHSFAFGMMVTTERSEILRLSPNVDGRNS